jgi:hypothetical protein
VLGRSRPVATGRGRWQPAMHMAKRPRQPAGGGPAHGWRVMGAPRRGRRAPARLPTTHRWQPHDEVYATSTREPRGWCRAMRERQGLTMWRCRRWGSRAWRCGDVWPTMGSHGGRRRPWATLVARCKGEEVRKAGCSEKKGTWR